MKVILALCLLGVASAGIVRYGSPFTYNTFPYTGGVLPYAANTAFPYSFNPVHFTGGVVPYSVPVQTHAVQAHVVQPGYVAKTPGATHYAPLPPGLAYASHHINLASAPGTE